MNKINVVTCRRNITFEDIRKCLNNITDKTLVYKSILGKTLNLYVDPSKRGVFSTLFDDEDNQSVSLLVISVPKGKNIVWPKNDDYLKQCPSKVAFPRGTVIMPVWTDGTLPGTKPWTKAEQDYVLYNLRMRAMELRQANALDLINIKNARSDILNKERKTLPKNTKVWSPKTKGK